MRYAQGTAPPLNHYVGRETTAVKELGKRFRKAVMIKLVKNEFFIYCKESRIENNRSFYGSFSLGPFDAGQSITIANALRRTLLSELKGLAITSAEIEGAFHEYSTLPGVRDSILDILLNLKDIVLKSINYGNKKKKHFLCCDF